MNVSALDNHPARVFTTQVAVESFLLKIRKPRMYETCSTSNMHCAQKNDPFPVFETSYYC